MKTVFTILTVLLLFQSGSYSNIIGVPSQYSTIQAAINASVNGDTILVEPGTYTENINFRGKRIVLTSRYYLTNDPATIHSTVINGSNPVHPDTASCVIISSGEDSTTVLQGFSVTGGAGTRWLDEHGAGIYREGGGILLQYSSPVIQFNIVYNNQVTNNTGVGGTGGGGIRIGDGYPRLYNNIFMNNRAGYGSGVVLNYTGCEMKNNVICANYGASQFGAGSVWIGGPFSRPKLLINNSIVSNSSLAVNGGINNVGGTTATLVNCIVWGNIPLNQQITGSLTVTYSDIHLPSGVYAGSGNINANPLFADSNYILQSGSPCVDKGDSSTVYNDLPDPNNPSIAKYPSRGGLRNDMGAYGGQLTRILTNTLIGVNGSGTVLPEGFVLEQNYPNPFNPSTNIAFSLPKDAVISLAVHDISGREISVLYNGFKPAGRHEIKFNSAGLSSGIYFCRLEAEGYSVTRKMILLK